MEDLKKPVTAQAAPKEASTLRRAHEEWAAAKKTAKWMANAAKVGSGWHVGTEVTESEFDQAVDNACNHVSR